MKSKNNFIIFFCITILMPFWGVSQMVQHTYSSKFDTIGYKTPGFPGGFDSLFAIIEKSCWLADSFNIIPESKINDALITFTITENGEIVKYVNKGTKIAGISNVMEKCITSARWTPGISMNKKKYVEASVQINFTYKVKDHKIQYIQKSPVYIFNYDIKKKLANSVVFSAGVFLGAIFGGGLFYLLVD